MRRTARALFAIVFALLASPAATQPAMQGVMAQEITIGTHLDLTGPLASWGQAVRNGLTLAIEEANEEGGVNGRKLRLIVKDDGYNSERAGQAARELVTQDRVFAILSPLGTPTAQAAMRQTLSRGVLYLFPLTASADAYLPAEPLKFAVTPSHTLAIQWGLRRILNARGPLRIGVLASRDDFGLAVKTGVDAELARRGLKVTALEQFTRGTDSDLKSEMERLRAERVDMVVLGAEAEEAIAALRQASVMRWRPTFLCSAACYLPELVTLGRAQVEGLYAVAQMPIPYPDTPRLKEFVQRYEAKFSKVASLQALTAYRNARLFLAVLRQAGQNPTQAGFARLLETRGAWTDPVLGGLPLEFMPGDHLGSHSSLLAQVRGGRWVVLADNLSGGP